jgi:hypothetical protein
MKIVVFDLDETLGYFVEFGIFWDCLNRFLLQNNYPFPLSQKDFNETLDLFPEFLRPNIINILLYLKNKKNSDKCDKLMIYTNNQGQPSWTNQLKKYFETKINYALFDQIIAAFKINGKRIEICRTSHDKSYHDFIKCTKLPLHAEICFIDDNYFPDMHNKNVYYINLKPYIHDLDFDSMISTFLNSAIGKEIILNVNKNINVEKEDFEKFMKKEFKLYNYTLIKKKPDEHHIDTIISKQILIHLEEFFEQTSCKKTKTRKNALKKRNKTHRR